MNLKEKIVEAIRDEKLKSNLWRAVNHSLESRKKVIERNYKNWEELRTKAKEIRKFSCENLEKLWEEAREKIERRGGKIFFAKSKEDALKIAEEVLKEYRYSPIIKSKSMVSEEIELRSYLEKKGFEIYETDLGELIVQLEGKLPSHITAPAIHLSKEEISEIVKSKLGLEVSNKEEEITLCIRNFLREKFLNAKASITGANFIVSENGSLVLFENEGNIRYCLNVSEKVLVITGYEKIIPKIEELKIFTKLLPVSATGQYQNSYTSFYPIDKKFNLIVLIDFRKKILNSNLKEVLYCIKCGCCLNSCPVFSIIGGHSYFSVYPGPIGIMLSIFSNPKYSKKILNFCSLCLACTENCPVKIEIHKIILKGRSFFANKALNFFGLISKKSIFDFSFNLYNLLPFFLKEIFMKNWTYNREILDFKKKDFFDLWKSKK